MTADRYFGTYARFETVSKRDAAVLLGSDCIIGDNYLVDIRHSEGSTRTWIVNRFGTDIGFLDECLSHKISVFKARGWIVRAILTFVAFTEEPAPGHYWGEVAILAYDPSCRHSFDQFTEKLSHCISQGIRPEIGFGNQAVDKIAQSDGAWVPTQRAPQRSLPKGTVPLKQSRSLIDMLVNKGRQGNKGCYAASWVFLLAVIAVILFGLKSCLVF